MFIYFSQTRAMFVQDYSQTEMAHAHDIVALTPNQAEDTHGDARQPSLSREARRSRGTHGARLSGRTHWTRSALLACLAGPSRFSWDARRTGRTRISDGARLSGGTHGTNHARRTRGSLVPCFALGRNSTTQDAKRSFD